MRPRSIVFGDVDLSPYIDVTSVNRPVIPTRGIERTSVPGMDGELAVASGLEAMELTVTGYMTARALEDVSKVRRLLSKMLMGGEQPLRLPDEPWLYLMAIYEGGAEPDRHAHRPKLELPFLCADPVAHGARRSETLTGTTNLLVGGTYRTWPVVTVMPPSGSSWQITKVATGEFVRVAASFNGRQTLTLDMGLQRCTVNGTDHAVDVSSDFFSIEGIEELRISGGSATIEWEERWL